MLSIPVYIIYILRNQIHICTCNPQWLSSNQLWWPSPWWWLPSQWWCNSSSSNLRLLLTMTTMVTALIAREETWSLRRPAHAGLASSALVSSPAFCATAHGAPSASASLALMKSRSELIQIGDRFQEHNGYHPKLSMFIKTMSYQTKHHVKIHCHISLWIDFNKGCSSGSQW